MLNLLFFGEDVKLPIVGTDDYLSPLGKYKKRRWLMTLISFELQGFISLDAIIFIVIVVRIVVNSRNKKRASSHEDEAQDRKD